MKPYYQKDSSYREIFYWLFELIPFLLPVLLLGSPPTTWFLTTLYLIFLLLKNGSVGLIQSLKISNHVSLCWLIWALMTFLIQKISQVWEILLNYFFDFFFLSLSPFSLSLSLSLSLSHSLSLSLSLSPSLSCTQLSELLNWFNCLLFSVQVFHLFYFSLWEISSILTASISNFQELFVHIYIIDIICCIISTYIFPHKCNFYSYLNK